MVARVLAGYGRIDVLVNNAGAPGPIVALNEMAGADWHAVFASNVDSVFYAVHEVLPCMMRNHYGRIINVSSSSLRNPPPLRAAYMASKAAVETLSFATPFFPPSHPLTIASAAQQVGRQGGGALRHHSQQCRAQHGPHRHDAGEHRALRQQRRAPHRRRLPRPPGTLGHRPLLRGLLTTPTHTLLPLSTHACFAHTQPDEVANAVVFLASKESAVITGSVIEVNGCTL